MFVPLLVTLLGKRKSVSPSGSDGSNSSSQCDSDEVDNPVGIEGESEESFEAPCNTSEATLGQLFTTLVPDANIHCPNIIIIGGQSSGKTKMIVGMVFLHLVDNCSITDAMGESLLRIFATGEKMMTRRPTKIQFVKAAKDSPCEISLRLGNDSASFGDPKFEEIIDTVHQESATKDGRAFRGELRVIISAPGLPNISFTDLPGLITDDRNLSDCHEGEAMSIRKLVKAYVRQPQTTLVVVEPASTEDFETSQVSPLLKKLKETEMPEIFSNAVLVLSKCDKIRQGLERRIMSIIERTSPSLHDFPFRHVVGVVNKIETAEEAPEETTSYAAFKQQFKATKAHERAIFSAFLQRDGITPCSTKEQCTTSAVFHQMDMITFVQVHKSVENGLLSIQEKVNSLEQKIRDELAPPLSFYDTVVHTSAGASGDTGDVDSKAKRKNILKLLRINLKNIIASKFKSAPELSIYERHSYDQQLIAASQSNFLASLGVEWPADFTPGDMLMSTKQSDAIKVLRKYFNRYIDRKIKVVVSEVFADRVTGCFAPIHSRFHRIDRFPRLVEALHQGFQSVLLSCLQSGKAAVDKHLDHFWEFEVPKGAKLDGIVDQLKHVALREVSKALDTQTDCELFHAVLLNDYLFEEGASFVALRNQLQEQWCSLYQQATILRRCQAVTSNDDLRVTLQQAYVEELSAGRSSPSQDSWLEFWLRAETAPPLTTTSSTVTGRSQNHLGVNPPSTSMYSAEPFTSSQSMDVDYAAAGGTNAYNDSGSRMDAPEDPLEASKSASVYRSHRSKRIREVHFKNIIDIDTGDGAEYTVDSLIHSSEEETVGNSEYRPFGDESGLQLCTSADYFTCADGTQPLPAASTVAARVVGDRHDDCSAVERACALTVSMLTKLLQGRGTVQIVGLRIDRSSNIVTVRFHYQLIEAINDYISKAAPRVGRRLKRDVQYASLLLTMSAKLQTELAKFGLQLTSSDADLSENEDKVDLCILRSIRSLPENELPVGEVSVAGTLTADAPLPAFSPWLILSMRRLFHNKTYFCLTDLSPTQQQEFSLVLFNCAV